MWDKFVVNYALPGTVKILIGNKTDLETERKITKEEGKVMLCDSRIFMDLCVDMITAVLDQLESKGLLCVYRI